MPVKKLKKDTPVAVKKLINNVVFVVDGSGSMQYHLPNVNRVVNELMKSIDQTTIQGQETRVSVYCFDYSYNIQQFRHQQPASACHNLPFFAHGQTALIDATLHAINEHEAIKFKSDVNEEHSFLVYVITDGQENSSRNTAQALRSRIEKLDENFWTMAIMVPDVRDVHTAKLVGFPAGNITVWNTQSKTGFEEAGRVMSNSYANYSTMRSTGVSSTKNLFQIDAAAIGRNDVRAALAEVKGKLVHAQKDQVIRPFVEEVTGNPYRIGSVFYELTKTEEVQPNKELVLVAKSDDKRFGGADARTMLGLPAGVHIKVKPGDHGSWRIFVQSTSVNRKIPKGASIFIKD